jgi:uncharacterized protein
MTINRYIRSTLAAVGAFWLLGWAAPCSAASGEVSPGYYADQKVAYHNSGAGPDSTPYFHRLLRNISNHLDAVGDAHVQIKVVSLGEGVVLFQQATTDHSLASEIDTLRARGVQFLICNNTLKGMQLDWHNLYGVKEQDIVPAGVAELARLQGMGYAYIHP